MVITAYAKVNLFLDIVGSRPDGYHDLLTVMHRAPVCDLVKIDAAPAGTVEIGCSVPALSGESNICHKAALRFFAESGISGGAVVYIDKKIPTGAGLGGGSADAAAVLDGLNRLYGAPLGMDALMRIAAGVGADVPFCLSGYKCAVCEGIGEVVTPISSELTVGGIEIRMPDAEGVFTREAYALYDAALRVEHSRLTAAELKKLTITPAGIDKILFNVFEQVIFPVRPDIAALKAEMSEKTRRALMSGSGAAVFTVG